MKNILYKDYIKLTRKEKKELEDCTIEMTVPELIKDMGLFIIKSIIVAALIVSVVGFAYVPSSSMEPTMKEGDLFFVVKIPGKLEYGDICVFKSEEYDAIFTKRLIAKGGDHVRIENGKVYVNDKPLDEPYLLETMIPLAKKEYDVPDGHLFFLGDNRNHSNDSRYWDNPYIEENAVFAKMEFRVWPLNRIGFVE